LSKSSRLIISVLIEEYYHSGVLRMGAKDLSSL
jgi:hypothetical protein